MSVIALLKIANAFQVPWPLRQCSSLSLVQTWPVTPWPFGVNHAEKYISLPFTETSGINESLHNIASHILLLVFLGMQE